MQEATGASGSDYYEHAGYNEWADGKSHVRR